MRTTRYVNGNMTKFLLVSCYHFCYIVFCCCQWQIISVAAATAATSSANSANAINSELVDKMSWKCANNASCLYAVANSVMSSYRRGEMVHFGVFDLVKLPTTSAEAASSTKNRTSTSTSSRTSASGAESISSSGEIGRGLKTGLVEFLSGNALRIPIGPMVFSVQPAEEDRDYIEIALLKKTHNQARQQGEEGRLGGDDDGGGGGGGLLGGGGGGSGGGGGGGGHRGRIRKHQEKKQFQMLIPMYLAASTFGWTLVAAKAVGLLTLKALAISKLALLVASMVIIKKMMDNASEKLMYQFPEHSPYMMPYSMDYGMHPMGGSEIATGDMYPAAMHMAAGPMHAGHPGLESMGAESSLHHNVATDVHNNTQMFAALNAAAQTQKVKREDSWLAAAKRRWFHLRHRPIRQYLREKIYPNRWLPASAYKNGDAFAVAAAAKVAEESVERADVGSEEDDIFNEEESVKETLEFLGFEIRKKKK